MSKHILLVFTLILAVALVSCSKGSDSINGDAPGSGAGNTDSGAGGNTGGGGDTGGRWAPLAAATWQWQLTGALNTGYDVDVYDIDLFDTSAAVIQGLHDQGRRVVCYFSAGSYEDWRPDAGDFAAADLGNALDGWPGERWLDIRSAGVRAVMQARLDLAVQKGCDAVEPDNVDGYANTAGIALTAADQLDYNRFLAQQAHQRNLAVALKNDVEQAADLADDFDFTVNEECHAYDECGALDAFIAAGKPVFNAEYADQYVSDAAARQSLCNDALAQGMHTLVLPLDLDDSFRYSCDDIGAGAPNQGSDGSVWKGHNWNVTNGGMAGVAPGSPNNVFVDANGYLHLRIAQNAGSWTAAEMFSEDKMGFGTYQWQLEGNLDNFDKATVLGLFPYGPFAGIGGDGENEIDIEFSKWNNTCGDCNADFTFWPATGHGSLGPEEDIFHIDLQAGTLVTARFTWTSTSIVGVIMKGIVPLGTTTNVLRTFSFAPSDYTNRIPQVALPLGMNFWAFQTTPATNQEVIIRDFQYVPLG